MSVDEQFGSRWGLILATLGMAVGTGNIWRFPRIVATNGGGSFLIAWVVFLLIWSIPLMILEFAYGKRARKGTIGAFARIAGKGKGWMGGLGGAVCHGDHVLLLGGRGLVPSLLRCLGEG